MAISICDKIHYFSSVCRCTKAIVYIICKYMSCRVSSEHETFFKSIFSWSVKPHEISSTEILGADVGNSDFGRIFLTTSRLSTGSTSFLKTSGWPSISYFLSLPCAYAINDNVVLKFGIFFNRSHWMVKEIAIICFFWTSFFLRHLLLVQYTLDQFCTT